MNTSPGFHPGTEVLNDYAQGNLSTGWSVALSAHIELCQSCKQRYAELESNIASSWAQEPVEKSTHDFSQMVANIIGSPQESVDNAPKAEQAPVSQIRFLDHSFNLPGVLAKAASSGLTWKKLAGGINQARLDIDNETQCEFIYMSPGSRTPMHKHQGKEITLVLDGSFSDESGIYHASDFLLRGEKDEHQPVSEEGCLCFAVLDRPLTFTRGVARLLNPINRYRFRKTIAQQF